MFPSNNKHSQFSEGNSCWPGLFNLIRRVILPLTSWNVKISFENPTCGQDRHSTFAGLLLNSKKGEKHICGGSGLAEVMC